VCTDVTSNVDIDVSDDVRNDVSDEVESNVVNVEQPGDKESEDPPRESYVKEIVSENLIEENAAVVKQDEVEDFQNKPLVAQSNKDVNESEAYSNGPSSTHLKQQNAFETFPSYDSGVGTVSSQDSIFDEYEEMNYTSFGAPTHTRPT
jgi:hypothetical protein